MVMLRSAEPGVTFNYLRQRWRGAVTIDGDVDAKKNKKYKYCATEEEAVRFVRNKGA